MPRIQINISGGFQHLMKYCVRCGSQMDFDAGVDGVCQNCEAASGHGMSGTDVPCQRCGMYLPPHELRMWNSRLYCAYCIMDVQDEERMMRSAGGAGSGGSEAGELSPPSGTRGTCERCGAQAGVLYELGGRRLCLRCH